MDLTELMMRGLAQDLMGTTTISYQGDKHDFGRPFARMTVKESILHYNPDISSADLDDLTKARAVAERLDIPLKETYGPVVSPDQLIKATV